MTPPKLCGDCGTQMEVNPDLFALPGIDPTVSADGQPAGLQFNFTRALPVTVYICPSCGRFKFMSALMLGNVEFPGAAQPVMSQSSQEQDSAK
jgi:hypothetical protein